MKVDVVIPTYKPDKVFLQLIEKLHNDMGDYVNQIIVMNTEESLWEDAVPNDFEKMYPGMEVFHINKADFDHANTRHEGFMHTSAPFVLFMTQDALPYDDLLIRELLKPFNEDEAVAVSYARQLPNDNCNALERLTRDFNYPEQSRVKSKADMGELGIKTFFCSNVCALYKRSVYEANGGFEGPAIFNEDMVFAGKLINAGLKVAYQATAKVIHSHNYTGTQQFHRNFDLGVSQTNHPEVFESVKSESEGIKMVKKNAIALINQGNGYLIPKLVWISGCKYLGYRAGKNYKSLSRAKIMKYTMNPGYWEKTDTSL